jgi:hypothetical protein
MTRALEGLPRDWWGAPMPDSETYSTYLQMGAGPTLSDADPDGSLDWLARQPRADRSLVDYSVEDGYLAVVSPLAPVRGSRRV